MQGKKEGTETINLALLARRARRVCRVYNPHLTLVSDNIQSSSLTSLLCVVFCPADQRFIRAEPGSTISLPCRAAGNKDVTFVEWSKADLGVEMLALLYREPQVDLDATCGSFTNRVDLKDVTNRDVSLILMNATPDDSGTYECRVVQGGNSCKKRDPLDTDFLSIITLTVDPGESDCFWIRTSSSFLVLTHASQIRCFLSRSAASFSQRRSHFLHTASSVQHFFFTPTFCK
uniref:Ig-like domain-containing protein n=1 Tax=Cyprinodon variegatus TaxID=28743 RepID=A0A3Q2DJD5_CYPVA